MLSECVAIEPEVCVGMQADGLKSAVKDLIADRLSQSMEGVAQASAALAPVALGPEQGCQRVAAMRLARHCQIDQQRQGFAQVEFDRPPVALQARGAKDQQLQQGHHVSPACGPHLTEKSSIAQPLFSNAHCVDWMVRGYRETTRKPGG